MPNALRNEKSTAKGRLDATCGFPNSVPRFQSKSECVPFAEEYNTHHGGSPPDAHIHHPRELGSDRADTPTGNREGEVGAVVRVKRVPREYLAEEPAPSNDDDSRNLYEWRESWNVVRDINYRLNLPIHRRTTPREHRPTRFGTIPIT